MIGRWRLGTLAALAAAMTFASPAAQALAGPKTAKTPEPGIAVVAHVPLQADRADQIFVREGAKNAILLYVVQESGQAISIVDITAPARATIVQRVSASSQGMSGRLVDIGANTIAVESDNSPAPAIPMPVKTVRLLDLSNPSAPRVALQYEHVSSYILDASRSLIYLVNDEGLWIIRHSEPMDWKTKAWMEFASTP